jgi:hypothetical protein
MDCPYQPSIIDLPERPGRRFFLATKQGYDWYNPIEPTISNELCWLRDHLDLGKGRKMLDAGCHHGYYICVLGGECEILGVDIHYPNLEVAEVNCYLNCLQNVRLWHGGIAHQTGQGFYNGKALGSLWNDGVTVDVARPQDLYPEANIVKLDIEGAEYWTVPVCIDEMPNCDTWIVEMHLCDTPDVNTDPNYLVGLFLDRGYRAGWWDRAYTGSPLEVCGKVTLHRQSTFLFTR